MQLGDLFRKVNSDTMRYNEAVDKIRNMEHPGTFRNIPEHPGTSNNYDNYEKNA